MVEPGDGMNDMRVAWVVCKKNGNRGRSLAEGPGATLL